MTESDTPRTTVPGTTPPQRAGTWELRHGGTWEVRHDGRWRIGEAPNGVWYVDQCADRTWQRQSTHTSRAEALAWVDGWTAGQQALGQELIAVLRVVCDADD